MLNHQQLPTFQRSELSTFFRSKSPWISRTLNMAETICQQIWNHTRRSQWPRGLRRGGAATRLLGLGIRIPPGAWMSVSYECCVLLGRSLCEGPISRPKEY